MHINYSYRPTIPLNVKIVSCTIVLLGCFAALPCSLISCRHTWAGRSTHPSFNDEPAEHWDSIQILKGHRGSVEYVEFSRRSDLLITSGPHGASHIWDAGKGKLMSLLDRGGSKAHFAPDDDSCVIVYDGVANVWSLSRQRWIFTAKAGDACFTEVGQHLIVEDDIVLSGVPKRRLFQLDTGKELRWQDQYYFPSHYGQVFGGSPALECTLIQHTGYPWDAKLWNAKTRREVVCLKNLDGVRFRAFLRSGDGSTIVTLDSGVRGNKEVSTIRIWSATSGVERVVIRDKLLIGSSLACWAIAPSGDRLATVHSGHGDPHLRRRVHIWNLEDGEMASVLHGHKDDVLAVDFSRNGRWLASASMDGTARVWARKVVSAKNTP